MAKNILIIDDSTSFRQVVRIALTGAGYAVTEAGDGMEAIQRLGTQRFNLIVCDVNMPRMDGITFVKHVKTQPSHKFTPIIMLTTESQEAKKAEGKAAGARAWMTKPFQPSQLLDAVNRLCA
ncbi:response regulator [Derxia lacustris]|uniref:response regulator n=1 Tax=Derxia lacustris TaxID=764842 RepID=UPI000A1749CB|nr:response regulator [Derxia lacustris]